MTQQDLANRIGEFLKHANDYWQWWKIEGLRAAMVGQPADIDGASFVEAQGNRFEARNGLLKIGSVLAVELEAQDNDSSALLLFLYAVDGGGGPESAGKGWPGLKVQLQRIAIRAGMPQPTNKAPELPDHIRRAGESYDWVCKQRAGLIPEQKGSWYCKEQWEYIRDHDCPAYSDGEVPAEYRTWVQYLTIWRRAMDGPMNSPRGGRPHGPSIIPANCR